MSIINKPNTIQKNNPTQFTLNKSILSLVPLIASDTYFSDISNWKQVLMYYKSNSGKQKEVLRFNAELPLPIASFLISPKAKNNFEIQKIIIMDFDNGYLVLNRSDITTSQFDIDLNAPSGFSAITWNNSGNHYSVDLTGGLSTTTVRELEPPSEFYINGSQLPENFELRYSVGTKKINDRFGLVDSSNQFTGYWYRVNPVTGSLNTWMHSFNNSTNVSTSLDISSSTISFVKTGGLVRFYVNSELSLNAYSTSVILPNVNLGASDSQLTSASLKTIQFEYISYTSNGSKLTFNSTGGISTNENGLGDDFAISTGIEGDFDLSYNFNFAEGGRFDGLLSFFGICKSPTFSNSDLIGIERKFNSIRLFDNYFGAGHTITGSPTQKIKYQITRRGDKIQWWINNGEIIYSSTRSNAYTGTVYPCVKGVYPMVLISSKKYLV